MNSCRGDSKQRAKNGGWLLANFFSIVYFPNMYYLPYNANLKTFSRQLRNNSTLGEILLWKQLRAGSMRGYTFNRQKPLDNYIVDFYCKPLNLVIEVDGSYHLEPAQRVKDNARQIILEGMGLSFLRFAEMQVRMDMNLVLHEIENYISTYEAKHPEVRPRRQKTSSEQV